MPKFKLEPVRYATWLLTLLIAVETVNEGAHLLPRSWTPYLLAAIALLTLLLGGAGQGDADRSAEAGRGHAAGAVEALKRRNRPVGRLSVGRAQAL